MKKVFTLLSILFLVSSVLYSQTVISIDSARNSVNDTVTVAGIAISPNLQTTGRSYYIWDGTGAITTYIYGLTSPAVKMGDSVMVTGKVSLYHGLIELNLLTDTSLVILDSNAVLPDPEVITLSEYLTNPENYESHLIEIKGLTKTKSSVWPSIGNKSIYLTDGSADSVQVFIAAATGIFNKTEPKWPVNLVGLGSQYGTDTTGYEIIPRFISDFISKVISVDSARNSVNDTVTVTGVAISPNLLTTGRSYYIWDGTGAITTYIYGLTSPAVKMGDSVMVTGKVSLYHGLIELNLLTDTSLVILDSNAVLPDPEVITLSEYLTNPENYESHLIEIKGLTKTKSSVWPSIGNKSIYLTDGSADSVQVFIAAATGIFNETEPTWPVNLVGLGSQYGTDTTGYEIIPRYINDFMPVGNVPVELTSFSAQVSKGTAILSWKTATEINNSGFEVERSLDGKSFVKVGFISGHGTTAKVNTYSYSDELQNAGEFYYRLKQIDFNGSYKYSEVVQATSIAPKSFSLSQNYPNPFNPSTVINYDLPVASKVLLKVYDILGNEVSTLVNKEEAAGSYKIVFNTMSSSNHKQLSSGVYFYKIEAGNFSAIKKMMLIK